MIWHNGELKPDSEAKLSIYDEALMFGTMVFEMMRTFRKRTFRLDEHLDRLFMSMKYMEIEIPWSKEDIYMAHEDLLIENRHNFTEDDEIRSLINVSRGSLPIYWDFIPPEPQVMIACFPLRHVLRGTSRYYDSGVEAIISAQRAIPAYLLDPKIKSRSRQHLMKANLEVKKQNPEAWALMLDPDGYVTEGTGSNFFMIKNNKFELYTPEPRNILRGVSRKYVINLAKMNGIEVLERNLNEYDLYEATEAFFTCTPYSIVPCTTINGREVGDGKVGRVTQRLMRKWSEDVGCDFVTQAKEWDREYDNPAIGLRKGMKIPKLRKEIKYV